MCLPWQHWTKALVWFDDVDISAFHSCVVVDIWQSLSEWHLLLPACVLVCRSENVGAWIRAAKVLATKQITVMEHPHYSPDLAARDFFLFPKINEILKWRHFDDIDDVRSNTTSALKVIPQIPKGSTLKATTVVFSNEVCSTFTAMSSRTLLSDHVSTRTAFCPSATCSTKNLTWIDLPSNPDLLFERLPAL